MKKVCVLLAEGFEEVEALTAVDLLRRAKVYVDTVSVTEDYIVLGAHGISVQTEDLFREVDFADFDMIVLPGGMPGTTNLEAHSGLRQVLTEAAERGQFLAAICAAPTILGKMGLLKGRKATCYPGMEAELEGAVIGGGAVVTDGPFITSRGVGTAIDFALQLITVLTDEEKAGEIAKAIVY